MVGDTRLWPMHGYRDISVKMCLSVKRTVKTTRGWSHITPTYNVHPFNPYHLNATTTRSLRVWKLRSRRLNGPWGRARMVNRGRMTSTFKYIIYRKPEGTRVSYCRLPAIPMTTYINHNRVHNNVT